MEMSNTGRDTGTSTGQTTAPDPTGQAGGDPIVVIKYGGNAMTSLGHKREVARGVVRLRTTGFRPVVVHGGGPAITEYMERLDISPVFVDGLRKTGPEAFGIVEMVLCGKVNKDLVRIINTQGGLAVGLCGKDGMLLRARKHMHTVQRDGKVLKVDLGQVGEVDHIDIRLLHHLLAGGYIPVIAPIGYGEDDTDYNINADIFAGDLAVALGARRLIYVTDVDGLMRDPGNVATRVGRITPQDALDSVGDYASGGMVPKVESAAKAVLGGVGSAHIVNGTVDGSIIGAVSDGQGAGTTICANGADGGGK